MSRVLSTFKVECGERFLNDDVARNEAFDERAAAVLPRARVLREDW